MSVAASNKYSSESEPKSKQFGTYPFFQEDSGVGNRYFKEAREATDAEWKLLARYEETQRNINLA